MVGRWNLLSGWLIFRCENVSFVRFREGYFTYDFFATATRPANGLVHEDPYNGLLQSLCNRDSIIPYIQNMARCSLGDPFFRPKKKNDGLFDDVGFSLPSLLVQSSKMATKHHDTFPATSRNNNLRGSVFWFLSRSTLLLGNAVSFRITMAITEGTQKRWVAGAHGLRVPKKIRKQISIICCWSWMGEMFGDFGWCHFRKSSEKHREQKRSSEETTNTRGKNIEISGWSTWARCLQTRSSKSMVKPSSNSPKGVCAMCAENGRQMLEKIWKNDKKLQSYMFFYFHPDT